MTEKKIHDFSTPPWISNYMVNLIPGGVKTVLEPSPGKRNIINAMNGKYQITAPNDFFLLDKNIRFDCVVMNPPFSSRYCDMTNAPQIKDFAGMKVGYYFLYKCMEMSDNVIALMPWFTISDSDVRTRYIMDYGLKTLIHLPRKTFNYTRIQTIIIVLEKGFKGNTIFKYLG